MAELKNKRIITVALTGAWPKKENNPNVPMTPAEISEDIYACWKGRCRRSPYAHARRRRQRHHGRQ